MGAIIAFDPGHTTGVVVFEEVSYEIPPVYALTYAGEIGFDQRDTIQHALQKLASELDAIVIEDFKLFASHAQAQVNSRFPSVTVIETIRVYARLAGIEDKIVIQQPGLKTAINPDHESTLKKSPHVRSAYFHARYYLIKRAKESRPKK